LLRIYNFSQISIYCSQIMQYIATCFDSKVIIRLFVEPHRKYSKYSEHFEIPKKFHLKIQVKLLQYCCAVNC
jgi:hypothetical protein